LVRRGLKESRGRYKALLKLFGMPMRLLSPPHELPRDRRLPGRVAGISPQSQRLAALANATTDLTRGARSGKCCAPTPPTLARMWVWRPPAQMKTRTTGKDPKR